MREGDSEEEIMGFREWKEVVWMKVENRSKEVEWQSKAVTKESTYVREKPFF